MKLLKLLLVSDNSHAFHGIERLYMGGKYVSTQSSVCDTNLASGGTLETLVLGSPPFLACCPVAQHFLVVCVGISIRTNVAQS